MNNELPSSNMRRLKRVMSESGLIYTLETSADRARDNLLCNYCAAKRAAADEPECLIYASLSGLEERGVLPMIRACKSYQPIITFKPRLIGFDSTFNTFRIGSAWYQRLMPGVVVGLMNTQTNEVFAKATVLSVTTGPFQRMCQEHAYQNHMLLGMKPEEAATRMEEILRQVYGKLIADNKERIETTVIYLKNNRAYDLQDRAASG